LQTPEPQLFGLGYLVGAEKKGLRDAEVYRLGGLKVSDHLERGRNLNGQLRRLCAA
jgi:hypothetical protein